VIGGQGVEVKGSIRYLGLELDQRLTFTPHVNKVSKAATDSARPIGRLMPYISGPSYCRRHLPTSVVHSKLLYAAAVWAAPALKVQRNLQSVVRVQRLAALRVIRAYRTVSEVAALMLARILPADLLSMERTEIRRRTKELGRIHIYKYIIIYNYILQIYVNACNHIL